jgi:hypothetical protein
MNGKTPKPESRPSAHRLIVIKEEVVVQYILDLDMRGFGPRYAGIEDMANLLLTQCNGGRVSKYWAEKFIKRQSKFKMHFNCTYDFQRALCKDSELIGAWFKLVFNMRAKYGIQDCDFYNFDETSFIMGVICTSMVVTRANRLGHSKVIQPGNYEWVMVIECINGEGWCLPPFLIVQDIYHLANWYTESNLPLD